MDVPGYATLSGLRRGPESCGSRSRGSGRSSNRSLTRSEISEALRGATYKIVGDLTQEIRAKLEPLIPPQASPTIVGVSPHRVHANQLVAGLTNTLGSLSSRPMPTPAVIPRSPFIPTTAQPSYSHVGNSTRAELDRLGLTALRAMVDVEPYGSSDLGGDPSDDETPSMTSASPSEDDGPAEGIMVEPSGMVLVLAADIVRGVLHASRVRRACPQWTIQVYTPPRAWPFSTWAVLAVMWHLAPENAPTGTAEQIARDLHTWPPMRITPGAGPGAASQWHPRQRGSASRQPFNGTPTRGHATSCRRARSRPPRQTPSGDATQGRRNRSRAPGSSRCGICPWAPWPTPLKPSRGLSRSRSSPAWPCSAACRRGPPGYGGRKEAGARAPICPWSRARHCSTPRAWGPWNGGRSCPARRAGGSPRPPHSPCHRRQRATASYG